MKFGIQLTAYTAAIKIISPNRIVFFLPILKFRDKIN